jgi:hypothetical protein
MEQFLREAKIVSLKATAKGVTHPKRATLEDGAQKHDAGIQVVDERKPTFEGPYGRELDFRDYWGYNVAGYEVAKLLELNMVPPYVERKVGGSSASFSWWVNDVMMDEAARHDRKLDPPDPVAWHREVSVARVFNQLICNTDDNRSNFLITHDWKMWMIDFTRAFRKQTTVHDPKLLTDCDRKLLTKLRALSKPMLTEKLKPYVSGGEIDGLLARRDQMVRIFESEIAQKGEAAVLFDMPRSGQRCGTGL